MKVALISPYPDVTAFGLRTISAYLKENGHKTRLIFLPDVHGDDAYPPLLRYDDRALDGLFPILEDVDLIGFTLMTSFYSGVVQVTEKIKSRLEKPVVWGGVHPTIMPEECMKTADMACVGEGEEALLDLLDRMEGKGDVYGTLNMWFRRGGGVIKNPLRSMAHDLDRYPIPDYSLDDHHILFDGKIQPMTREILQASLERAPATSSLTKCGYQTMTGRGCPHRCTYCLNDKFESLAGDKSMLRWRSVGHVIRELVWVKENMPYVGHVFFSDDAFFAKGAEKIREFCAQYKEKIALPFFALTSPLTLTEEKMALMVDAGMGAIQMGIESGSKHIQEIFNRRQMSNERVLKAALIINKHKDRMLAPSYDFILNTPYETDDDRIETLKFISTLPKPYRLQTFSLRLYPGTKLYEMAKRDGLIEEVTSSHSIRPRARKLDYITFLYSVARRGWTPGWLLRALVSRPVLAVMMNRAASSLIKGAYAGLKYFREAASGLLGGGDKGGGSHLPLEVSR